MRVLLQGAECANLAALLAAHDVKVTLIAPDPHDLSRLADWAKVKNLPLDLLPDARDAQDVDLAFVTDGHGPLPDVPVVSLDWEAATAPSLHVTQMENGKLLVERSGPDPSGLIAKLAEGLGASILCLPKGLPPLSNLCRARLNSAVERLALCGAPPCDVDEILVAAGFDIGPFESMDQVGLDTSLLARAATHRILGDTSAEDPLMARAVAEGRLGRKVGVGWYRYPGNGGKVEDPLIEDMASEEARFAGVQQTDPSEDDILRSVRNALQTAAQEAHERGASRTDILLVLRSVLGWQNAGELV